MIPQRKISRHGPPSTWLLLCCFVGFAARYLVVHGHEQPSWFLQDLQVYADALKAFNSGRNPYEIVYESLHFVYPPAVLYLGRWFALAMPAQSGRYLLAGLELASVLALPFVLARYYLTLNWLTPLLAGLVWFAEPRFAGMSALTSGNIAVVLYMLCILAAVPGVRKGRWRWFYAALLLAVVVKITFVVLLLLPLCAGRRQWWRSVGFGAVTAVIYELQMRLMPGLYAGYLFAVRQQIQGQGRYGFGVFGVAAKVQQQIFHQPVGAFANAVYLLCAAAVLGLLLWLRSRGGQEQEPSLWLAMVLLGVVIVNPRLMDYDAYVGLFAAYVVLAEALKLRGWELVALVVVEFLPSLAVPRFVHSPLMHGTYELLVILVAFAVGVVWIVSDRFPGQGDADTSATSARPTESREDLRVARSSSKRGLELPESDVTQWLTNFRIARNRSGPCSHKFHLNEPRRIVGRCLCPDSSTLDTQ